MTYPLRMTETPASAPHIPVLLTEMLGALSPQDGEVYVDGTFGGGGYTNAILESADCTVIAIDQDEDALKIHGTHLQNLYKERLVLQHGRFGDTERLVQKTGNTQVDGLILDIGVSSMQLDEAERGFSFRHNGPLDMRMDPHSGGPTAADIVNTLPEAELADIIHHYGEERFARRVARQIVESRPFTTTRELAEAIRGVVPVSFKEKTDPATRTFQALRIHVNDELEELEKVLKAAAKILKPGGRLVVVSFHSLEDRIVKRFLDGNKQSVSRHMPVPETAGHKPLFQKITRKPVMSSDAEMQANPRARSARLRAAVRTEAPT